MSNLRVNTLAELKQHAKKVGSDFFGIGNERYFGAGEYHGVYRAAYYEIAEGYVIAKTVFEPSDGSESIFTYVVYRFEASTDWLKFYYVATHVTLANAEAFLVAMGAVK